MRPKETTQALWFSLEATPRPAEAMNSSKTMVASLLAVGSAVKTTHLNAIQQIDLRDMADSGDPHPDPEKVILVLHVRVEC